MNANPQAILFRIGGLGDLLVALPSISLVRHSLPDFTLTLVGRPEYAPLFVRTGLVDEFMPFDSTGIASLFSGDRPANPGPAPLSRLALVMGWLIRRGDWPADDWWVRNGAQSAHFMAYENGAQMPMSRFFYDRTRDFIRKIQTGTRSPRRDRRQDSGHVFAPGREDSVEDRFNAHALLPIDSVLKQEGLGYFGLDPLAPGTRRLVVHPGSGGRAKRWPFPLFLEVIRRAASSGIQGVLVTGEAEGDYELLLKMEPLPKSWTWAANPPLPKLAGLLAESTAYLGNDSGPTHLAAACGLPVVALFRSENELAWHPFGKTRVISASAIGQISVADVISALGL